MRRNAFTPSEVGLCLGTSSTPRGVRVYSAYDRVVGVLGTQGSGKTLDVLVPALLAAPGAALMTLTKPEDLLLTFTSRQRRGPCHVLDPFGLVPGLPELVWDPVSGCESTWVAERRAKAFAAGTVKGGSVTHGDSAAQFYADRAATVLKGLLHAAAMSGQSMQTVVEWVSNPGRGEEPVAILSDCAPVWAGLVSNALEGDERTVGNTVATLHQCMNLFFQDEVLRRCVPSPGRPATDLAEVIANGGTFYLLGREDPYAAASPLMTAVAEAILDTALTLAQRSEFGRLCPPFMSLLDELPSTAALPTLPTRLANERALGLFFVWAAQARSQLNTVFGPEVAQTVVGLTNRLLLFGGSKDMRFNNEISEMLDTVRVSRKTYQGGSIDRIGSSSHSGDDIRVMTPGEIRNIPDRHALLIPDRGKALMLRTHRCIDGRAGRELLQEQRALRPAALHRPTEGA